MDFHTAGRINRSTGCGGWLSADICCPTSSYIIKGQNNNAPSQKLSPVTSDHGPPMIIRRFLLRQRIGVGVGTHGHQPTPSSEESLRWLDDKSAHCIVIWSITFGETGVSGSWQPFFAPGLLGGAAAATVLPFGRAGSVLKMSNGSELRIDSVGPISCIQLLLNWQVVVRQQHAQNSISE